MVKIFLAATVVPLTSAALAQACPARPVRLVVPFPPGGPADSVARVFAQELTDVPGWWSSTIAPARPAR